MSYVYQNLDGYKFICNVFAIISRDRAMKEIFIDSMKDLSNTANDVIIMRFLSENWEQFSSTVFRKKPELKNSIIKHYDFFYFGKENGDSLLKKYQDRWQDSVKGIIKERKETRDPHFAFGIAMTLAVAAMSNLDNRDFYIGQDEAKKILFHCLEYFEYRDIEFIPDVYFEETDDLRKLLFSSLFSTLMFLYPAKGGVTKSNNYDNGVDHIIKVIKSDNVSKLYSAFLHVAEAREVADQLWGALSINEQYLMISNSHRLPLEDFYILPNICSSKCMGVLTCENGQSIRSLVEGKSGCGKSTLAKIISLICQNELPDYGIYKEIATRLDFSRKMWPLVIDCKELRIDDLEKGIISVGLKQMVSRASTANVNINRQHYKECENYLFAFCCHKIMQGEFLLIIDDYSKIPVVCINEFNRVLKELCRNLTLHVVVITDKLQPSTKYKLSDSLNNLYNEFSVEDTFVDVSYISSVIQLLGKREISLIKPDKFTQLYVNTPRRLLRYAKALLNNESIHDIINSCLEEELDIKAKYFSYRDEYPDFVREITLLALRERREKERKNSKLTINEKQVRKVKSRNENWNAIWACIETESIMLEHSTGVNSMEFSTPLYLYNVLAEYYLEILQEYTFEQCAQTFIIEFALLSCMEFANVLALVLNRLYKEDFEKISDANVEIFIKAVVSKMFEVEDVQDIEYCQWALSYMMLDEYKTAFIHGGNTIRRERIWNTLKRVYISLDTCKDSFLEYGLLMS